MLTWIGIGLGKVIKEIKFVYANSSKIYLLRINDNGRAKYKNLGGTYNSNT